MTDLPPLDYGWREVSGYFDGDGCTDYIPRKWVLHPSLSFTDNFRPQLETMNRFLASQGVSCWALIRTAGAWKLGLGRAESLRRTASSMLPFVFKKRQEVKAVLDYLDSRITGTQFADVLNESVRIGNRTGSIRVVNLPYTRKEGQILRRAEMRENVVRSKVRRTIMVAAVVDQIRESLFPDAAPPQALRDVDRECRRVGWSMVFEG